MLPLLVFPSLAWFRRRQRPVVVAAAGLWIASAAAALLCLRWFEDQPYVVGMGVLGRDGSVWRAVMVNGVLILWCGVDCLLFVLPALTIYLNDWRARLRAPLGLALGSLFSGGILGLLLWRLGKPMLLGNIVTPNGILGVGTEAIGDRPEILPAAARCIVALVLGVSTAAATAALIERFRSRRGMILRDGPSLAGPDLSSLRWFLWLSVPMCLLYMLLILYRGTLFDRYFLPLLPVIAIPLLWSYQQGIRNTPPPLGWAVIGVLALYGVATTHDFLASGRARMRAASALTSARIPRTSITEIGRASCRERV